MRGNGTFHICSICGDHIGMGYDHTECSKIKKEELGRDSENKNPVKKLSKKQLAFLARRYR